MLRHASRAGHLLELWHESLDPLVWVMHGVGVAKFRLSPEIPECFITEGIRERGRFTQIPRFQFLTHDTDQHVVPMSGWAEFSQSLLSCMAVTAVVISDDREPDAGLAPSLELAWDAALQSRDV